MKTLLLGLLLLAGCMSQEEITARNAQQDHAFCSSVWGNSQEGYGNCRMMKAAERSQALNNAAILGVGMGSQIYQNSLPTYTPAPMVTCRTYGNMTSCM